MLVGLERKCFNNCARYPREPTIYFSPVNFTSFNRMTPDGASSLLRKASSVNLEVIVRARTCALNLQAYPLSLRTLPTS